MVESSADWTDHEDDGGLGSEDAPWVAPKDSPVTVVAHELRMRYKARRTDRAPRKGLAAKVLTRKQMVSVPAVRGVDLTVRQGEFVGIIGRNGSGKSTLLRMLAGVEPPTSGVVLTSARPQLLGVSAALMSELTGAENIRLGFLALGMTPEEADDKFEAAAELTALGGAIDLPMKTYSSGMGSRLKFAISLAANPSILMIDEALATGDATFAERSKQAMDGMLEKAGTVFLVNHAAQTIENMCSRAIWMERGQVILDGDAVEVARRYRWFAHNLAQGNDEKASGLLRDAIDEGREQRRKTELVINTTARKNRGGAAARPDRSAPELEPDPFMKIFSQDSEARSFPIAKRAHEASVAHSQHRP